MITPQSSTILVIDDDQEIRRSLKKILERRGYCVFTAEDGEEGLEKIKQLDIQIVFSDIMMPKISGIDFLKEVHKYSLACEVIMITGRSDLDHCIEAVEHGACGYLTKPVDIEEIVKSILVAERNIAEKKEIIKKGIGQLEADKVSDILKRVLKTTKNVEVKKDKIKKSLDKNREGS